MKKLAVIVTTPPTSPLTQTAYQFIETALSQSVELLGVFFYQSGVLNASQYLSLPNDEFPLHNKWQQLNKDHDVPFYLCSTAAEKHGLIKAEEPMCTSLIISGFTIAGLGELVELSLKADRVVQL
ncbi:sulfurtransferase complex subunit TusD [Thalassotalea castellviae]|uniref:Sulfurtransferase complex subunit TusD n=1 Tax=Thalassotalea castellviae TaxID=3075612 RepID=A0ABU2ZVM0_9GAMM|nr:sulfurtransferase complex subunit TusD [Thalassotalea sp. W431]MDT0601990.1 sulfurtransferase complex subunit TusD [Thalassotalea sp. W431]